MSKNYVTKNKISGQFAWRTIEMMESPAFRVLSHSARRILDRLEIEIAHHGGNDNGRLPCGSGSANRLVARRLVGRPDLAGHPTEVPAVKEFAFEVGLIARVRVRAPDEDSARKAVPNVIGAPGTQDIALANQGIDVLLPGVIVTAVDFIADRKVKLVRR
jgi:hypothetical protein